MEIKEIFILSSLAINFIGVLYAVFSSRIKIESRLTTLETYMRIIRNIDVESRESNNINDRIRDENRVDINASQ